MVGLKFMLPPAAVLDRQLSLWPGQALVRTVEDVIAPARS
jgi:hypothetical protein